MGSKYTSQSISGYNSSAPADDGTQTDSNKVKWSTIKTKLGDPIKTLAESMNTALLTALDTSTRSITANDTALATDNGKTIEIASTVTASLTVTLPDAATVGAGYMVSVFNSGSGIVTIARTGSNTINGATSSRLASRSGATFRVNASTNGYVSTDAIPGVTFASGTITFQDGITFASEGSYAWPITFTVGGNTLLCLDDTNKVGIKLSASAATAALDINDSTVRLRTSKTPASASATGNQGDICWDSSYVYVCVATNTWKRASLATW